MKQMRKKFNDAIRLHIVDIFNPSESVSKQRLTGKVDILEGLSTFCSTVLLLQPISAAAELSVIDSSLQTPRLAPFQSRTEAA